MNNGFALLMGDIACLFIGLGCGIGTYYAINGNGIPSWVGFGSGLIVALISASFLMGWLKGYNGDES